MCVADNQIDLVLLWAIILFCLFSQIRMLLRLDGILQIWRYSDIRDDVAQRSITSVGVMLE